MGENKLPFIEGVSEFDYLSIEPAPILIVSNKRSN